MQKLLLLLLPLIEKMKMLQKVLLLLLEMGKVSMLIVLRYLSSFLGVMGEEETELWLWGQYCLYSCPAQLTHPI